MKKNKIFNKIIYSVLLISLLLGNSIGTAEALFGGGPSVPSIGEVLDKVEKHYGFDSNILRRSQKKGDYPQVEVFFDKTAPKDGEKVTATAMPKHFKNTGQQLYYTWFLFKDGEDDIEEAKQLAMGIVARGDFNPGLFKADYKNTSNDTTELGAYEASYGGDSGVGGKKISGNPSFLDKYESNYYVEPKSKGLVDNSKITRCYRHNFGFSNPTNSEYDVPTGKELQTGGDLIIECEHKFPESPKVNYSVDGYNVDCDEGDHEVGDGEFTTDEAACWRLDPVNPDTDGDGFVDEADLAGLGQTQLTWDFEPGDRVGVVIEGTSMVPINETTEAVGLLSETITYNCSTASDGDYCIGSGMSFGECDNGSCVSVSNCSSSSSNAGKPCGTAGFCSYNTFTGVGTCDPVSSSCASNGDICQKNSTVGVCDGSECVISKCGSSGDKCQTDVGTLGTCDNNGFCQEDTDGLGDSSMNPYYKITWAGLDVCDREKVEGELKEDLIEKSDDECEGWDDYGFTYLATKKVSQEGEEILKPTLASNVLKAQVDLNNLEFSDYINVKASFDNQAVDPDFIGYEWTVYISDKDGVLLSAELINKGWVEGEINQGLGASSIKFRGAESDFKTLIGKFGTTDEIYFLVGLEIDENSGKSKRASLKIPIVKNDVPIKLLDKNGDIICDSGSYNKVCPVYPGQTLYAVYNGGATGSITGFSWELEGQKLLNQIDYYSAPSTVTSPKSQIAVPVVGSDMEIQTLSLKAKKDNGEEVTSERLLSVAKPMAKISSSDVIAMKVDDGTKSGKDSENVFIFDPGMLLFEAEMIPDYLDLNSEKITLNWYINNQLVDVDFIAANPGNKISDSTLPEKLEFAISDEDGDSINLTLEVIKKYTDVEKDLLKEAWGIGKIKDLNFKKSITLKKNSSGGSSTFVKGNSISVFMASTLNNTPEYFIFIIKTAIVFVLFWSLLFGFNYWFSREIKLKELND